MKLSSDPHTIHVCIYTHGAFTHRKENGGGWKEKEEEIHSCVKEKPKSRPSEAGLPAHPRQSLESHMQDFDSRGAEGAVLQQMP